MSVSRGAVESWLEKLRAAWEAGDAEAAVGLFSTTREYYERPFKPGTELAEIRKYWNDIRGLQEIRFDYSVVAIEGPLAVVHWRNTFVTPSDGKSWLLDGVFFIEFDNEGRCIVFRQWWFAAE